MRTKAAKRSRKGRHRWTYVKKRKNKPSRQLLAKLVRQKKVADKLKVGVSSCATRTVEWPSTHQTAKEKNKLLFTLALGLIPKFIDKKVQPNLIIRLEKLDPTVEAKARAPRDNQRGQKTQKYGISDRVLRKRPSRLAPAKPNLENLILVPLYLLPDVEEPRVSPENVEIVDLTSEDDTDTVGPAIENPVILPEEKSIVELEEGSENTIDLSDDDGDEYFAHIDATEHPDRWLLSPGDLENLNDYEFPTTLSPSSYPDFSDTSSSADSGISGISSDITGISLTQHNEQQSGSRVLKLIDNFDGLNRGGNQQDKSNRNYNFRLRRKN